MSAAGDHTTDIYAAALQFLHHLQDFVAAGLAMPHSYVKLLGNASQVVHQLASLSRNVIVSLSGVFTPRTGADCSAFFAAMPIYMLPVQLYEEGPFFQLQKASRSQLVDQ